MPALRRLDLRAAPHEESGDPPYCGLGAQSVTAANFTVERGHRR
jgi:hypothetical protein